MKTEVNFKGIIYDKYFKAFFRNFTTLKDIVNSYYQCMNVDKHFAFTSVITQSDIFSNHADKKQFFGDVLATLDNGELILFEAYTSFSDRHFKKSFNYLSRLYSNQMQESDKNYEKCKKVTCINFMKGNYHKMNSDLINSYVPKHKRTNNSMEEGTIEMVLIRLDKLNSIPYTEDEERFIRWLRIINSKSFEEMERSAKGDIVMQESIEFLKRYCGSDMDHGLDDMIATRELEAEEAGIKKGIITTAKKMLKDGLSIASIKKYTGLSKKQIEALK